MKSIALRQWEAAAYAAGRLTQLRRVCRPQPAFGCLYVMNAAGNGAIHISDVCSDFFLPTTGKTLPGKPHVLAAPYGAPGDRLALREGARMPLSAVRWRPVITAVRLERVQEMTEADAIRCGVETLYTQQEIDNKPGLRGETIPECGYKNYLWHGCATGSISKNWYHQYSNYPDAKGSFSSLWQRDNPRTLWASNPWTWVYEIEGNTK